MKYDRLYNFISPVTGKIPNIAQLPDIKSGYIIRGDSNNKPILSNSLIVAEVNIGLIQANIATINAFNLNIATVPFILKRPNFILPFAQSLNALSEGVLKNTIKNDIIGSYGELVIASKDEKDADYVSFNFFKTAIDSKVGGPDKAANDSVAVFAYELDPETANNPEDEKKYIKKIKESKATIDDSGNVTAKGFKLKNSINPFLTGFVSSEFLLEQAVYTLPKDSGMYDYILTRDIANFDGTYGTKWKKQISIPDNSNPVYIPPVPIPAPIGLPVNLTVPLPIPIGGIPVGTGIETPIKVDTNNGDIETPGDIKGNNADFDGDLSVDGDLSTQGDIDSLGDISAAGNVSGDSFDFEDISELSNDFVRMEAPFDLDHSYKIELADNEPIMQEQLEPPDQRILQTAWRRVKPTSNLRSLQSSNSTDNLTITKLSWTELEVSNPLTLSFVAGTSTTNEKMIIGYSGGSTGIDIPHAVDLVYGTINNIKGYFNGFNSKLQNNLVKVKTSYYGQSSSSGVGFFNRYDNGYIIKNDISTNCNLKLQYKENDILTDLLTYDKSINSFNLLKPITILTPTLPYNPATKEYVDSKIFDSGVTQITAGTGLTGGTITSTGTIGLANTSVTTGSYRLGNFTVNAQGQLTNASSSSPTSTTSRSIAVWGDSSGTSLLNTSVNIDTSGNISNNSGSSTFLIQQVNDADGLGALSFISGYYSLQFRLSGSLTGNRTWFLPTNNSNGFFKNDGFGAITWATLNSSDISNFSSAVTAFRLNQFALPNNNINFNGYRATNVGDPTSSQDLATKNYVDSKPFYTSGDFSINLDLSGRGGIIIPLRTNTSIPFVSTDGYLYVKNDGKLYFSNSRGTVLIGGA